MSILENYSGSENTTQGFDMKFTAFLFGIAVLIGACDLFITTIASATETASHTSAAARKTYKRRCTNYKCKAITEGTQPIFKCKICGSSTVPHKD
jgi:hypothetical protein